MHVRKRTHQLLSGPHGSDRAGRIVDVALIVLIVANVSAVILETSSVVYQGNEEAFRLFELFSVAVFTVEYILRVWSSVEGAPGEPAWKARLNYVLTPNALIDFVAVAPFYLSFFFVLDLRFVRVLRLLRLFKLTRYSTALSMLMDVMRREASAFLASFFILVVMLVISASGAYLVERHAQPEDFGSIPAAMWWAVATLTTVGYGDVTPVTVAGKVFGALITIIGIGMAAMPAGILASGLSAELSNRRQALREEYLKALVDGVIDIHEEAALEQLRRDLGLGKEEAAQVRRMSEQARDPARFCPHCGGELEIDHRHFLWRGR